VKDSGNKELQAELKKAESVFAADDKATSEAEAEAKAAA